MGDDGDDVIYALLWLNSGWGSPACRSLTRQKLDIGSPPLCQAGLALGLFPNSRMCIMPLRPAAVIPVNMGNLGIAVWFWISVHIRCCFMWTFQFFGEKQIASIYWALHGKKKITTRVGFSSGSQSLLVLPSSPLPSIKSSSLLKRCLHGKGKEDTDCVMDCRCNQIRCAWKAFPFGVEPRHL